MDLGSGRKREHTNRDSGSGETEVRFFIFSAELHYLLQKETTAHMTILRRII